ncbi:MAG TPA: hypothetical protein VKB37_18440 [Jatrophihabitantaceae bacterium]|nr:hypothetical protein [Jatrophihabitantaceae bacterium]
MSAVQRTGATRVLRWPGAAAKAGSKRVGRHHLGARARVSWYRMFYAPRHSA